MNIKRLIVTGFIGLFIVLIIQYFTLFQDIKKQSKPTIEKLPQCKDHTKSKKRIVQFDYSYIRKQHKEHLVRDYFDEKPCEWEVTNYDPINKPFDLLWVFSPHQIPYDRFQEGKQMVNHIQNLQKIVDKSLMVRSLREFDAINEKNKYYNISSRYFLPKTYSINFDSKHFTNEEKGFINDPEEGIWIAKPTNLFGGKGIEIVKNINEFKKQVRSTKLQQQGLNKGKMIIQKYIEKPYLIEKKKFDIRCYVFIVSTKPKYLALFHQGFIRRTLFEYSLDSKVLGFDFMLSESLDVYLIEINKSPSWQILNKNQQFKQKMLHKFIDTVFDVQENEQKSAEQISENLKDTNFDVIYNEFIGQQIQKS